MEAAQRSVGIVPRLHILRVFCAEDGTGGNPLGVFLQGAEVPAERRQAVAAELGFSETVFVEDAARGAIRIHTPAVELDFAGHPSVGAAWLIARERAPVASLTVPAGEVRVRWEGELPFVSARPAWGPPWELEELRDPADVEALDGAPDGRDLVVAWAWIDAAAGTMRARAFGERLGIAEDEATGSAATKLCALAGRPVEIRQGAGSRLLARPGEDGFVEIGGASAVDDVRDYALP
jgi:predicted PhzF superfamily epimerase YddE/YHI9